MLLAECMSKLPDRRASEDTCREVVYCSGAPDITIADILALLWLRARERISFSKNRLFRRSKLSANF